MAQAFYRKWRPQTWDEVVSQAHVIQTLRNAVRTGRTGHAYLLAGPRGTGKTTTARLLAKALNCLDPDLAKRPCDQCEHCRSVDEGRFLDLIEIDAASNTSVEDVRSLRDKINFSPTQGVYKVYIIDEVHMLSSAAFNALLKTLEEPPPHAVFILATTEVHKIPATILSRCQRYEFRRIPVEEIKKHLKQKAEEEGLKVDDDALTLIARQATGAMRDAISLLDQLSSTGQRVTLAEAQEVLGTATSSMVIELIDAVLAKDTGTGLKVVQAALDAGTDARQFARQVVEYLRGLLLAKMGNANQVDATVEMRQQINRHAEAFEVAQLLEVIRLFNNAAVDTRSAWHPGLALELALAESVEGKAIAAPVQPTRQAAEPQAVAPPVVATQTAGPALKAEPPSQRTERSVLKTEPAAPDSEQAAPLPERAAPPAGQKSRAESAGREAPAASKEGTLTQKGVEEARRLAAGEGRGQTQPPKPQPAAGQTQPAGKVVTQAEIQHGWAKVRQVVKSKNSLTAAALNSVRTFILKDNVLILGFQTEVVKSKMETPENIEILRQALQSILGAPMGVRCIVVGNKGGQPADLDVDGDGMVGTALDLGGKIVFEE